MTVEPLHDHLVLAAPRSIVWATLADLEGVNVWNPSIDGAECVTDKREGVGARRRCRMAPSGWMTETVTEWEPGRVIAFAVEEASPLRSAVGRFVLDDADLVHGHPGGTRLEASFDYEVRFGPLGPVIDRLIVHRQLATSWQAALGGLRIHVEGLARA